MTEDEYERIKEHEKDRLRAQRAMRKTMRSLQSRQKVQHALQRMKRAAHGVLSRTSNLIDQLTSDTALQEARLELALDDAGTDPEVDAFERERTKERAQRLVRQMKQQSRTRRSGTTSRNTADADEDATTEDTDADEDDLPDKTIGRMR